MSIVTASTLILVGMIATCLVYSCNDLGEVSDWVENRAGQAAVSLTLTNEYFWLTLIGVVFSLLFL